MKAFKMIFKTDNCLSVLVLTELFPTKWNVPADTIDKICLVCLWEGMGWVCKTQMQLWFQTGRIKWAALVKMKLSIPILTTPKTDYPKHSCNPQSIFDGGCGNKHMKFVNGPSCAAESTWWLAGDQRTAPVQCKDVRPDSSLGQRPHNSLAESFAEKFLILRPNSSVLCVKE